MRPKGSTTASTAPAHVPHLSEHSRSPPRWLISQLLFNIKQTIRKTARTMNFISRAEHEIHRLLPPLHRLCMRLYPQIPWRRLHGNFLVDRRRCDWCAVARDHQDRNQFDPDVRQLQIGRGRFLTFSSMHSVRLRPPCNAKPLPGMWHDPSAAKTENKTHLSRLHQHAISAESRLTGTIGE